MTNSNRDLLLLFKQDFMTPQAIEHEVEFLHELLYMVERMDNVSLCCELINVNTYKITQKKNKVYDALRQKELKAFVFINCRN